MKKLLLLACFVMGVSSCAKHNEAGVNTTEAKLELSPEESRALLYSMGKTTISPDQVESYAHAAIGILDNGTRSSRRSIGEIKPIVDQKTIQTRSGSQVVNDTAMYIVNFSDNKGYAVIATDMLTSNIVAIVDQGSLSSLSDVAVSQNPMLCHSLMSHLTEKAEMHEKQESLAKSAKAKAESRTDIASRADVASPRYADGDVVYGNWYFGDHDYVMQTLWGDGPGFNDNCPVLSCGHKALAGHSAAAIAQIAQYKQKMEPYKWHSAMELYPGNKNVPPEVVATIKSLYADLANRTVTSWSCGNQGCMNYNHGLSQGTIEQSVAALNYLGLSTTAHSISDISTLKLDVRSDHPVLMTGVSSRLDLPQRMFSWVADGYGVGCRTMTVYYNGMSIGTIDTYENLIHCNMGYEGVSNGYYQISYINLGKVEIYDYDWMGSASGYYPEGSDYITIR